MSGLDRDYRIMLQAPVWYVPPTLADLECRHGELEGCTACEREAREAELDRELELAGTP